MSAIKHLAVGRRHGRSRRAPTVVALGAAIALAAPLMATSAPATAAGERAPAAVTNRSGAPGQITVSKSSVNPGSALKMTGSVPAKSYRAVQLQAAAGTSGTWVKAGKSQTDRTGKFVFKVDAPSKPGTVQYRVYAPKAAGMRAVTTRSVGVTVVDPPGSRSNPYVLGQTFRVGDWRIVVNSTDYDSYPESNHDIFDAPEPGWTFVSFNATFTYNGEGASRPDMDLAIDFLASDSRVYDAYSGGNICGNAKPDLDDPDDVNDMYAGATVTASDCVSVPSSLAHDGLWRFESVLGVRDFFVRAD